jgi:class 3 adenylate cyclase
MVERALRFAYRRLGPRYPAAVLVALFALAYGIGLGGVAALSLYQDMTTGELLAIAGATVALVLLENVLALGVALRLVRPADRWLRGERTPGEAVRAWRALAGLPIDFLTKGRWVAVLGNTIPISLFITLLLDLTPVAFGLCLVGSGIVLVYGVLLRFYGMELLLRPVLEDIAHELPDRAELTVTRIPLRWKLLVALPAINVVTGVIVAGISKAGDTQTLADLGWDVLVAVVVSFTISFELTLLLSRSVTHQLDALRQGTARVARGERGVRVPLLSTDETGALAASFNEMVADLDEREKLREAFGAFVAPEVVTRVLEQGTTDLEGEEVDVSVLFLDIRDFTRMSERLSAREVVQHLNEFYGHVVPLVERHGGHANKFIGDGLLAVFGAPEKVADHADRAVLCALHVHEAICEVYGGRLQVGIGVNSGTVLAGTVGGGGRLDFTVIGDAVNTAARVEEATRRTGDAILITQATRRRLTLPYAGFDERLGVTLKGKSARVTLYAPVVGSTRLVDGERFRVHGTSSVSAHVHRDRL